MSMRRMAALQAGLLLVAMFANAASRKNTMRITVLDSETRSLSMDDNGVPTNCDQLTFDAYCRSTRTAPLVNTLLVQEGDEPPFRISCTIESRYSRCTPLPKGATFEARREKRGITVYYVDDKGKVRSQLYTLVAGGAKGNPAAPAATRATAAAPASVAPATKAPAENTGPAPAENAGQAPAAAVAASSVRETVKCSFSSTPSGAEVTLDGRYVGSTPSVLGLTVGTHVVVISMPGFAQWKRELTVASGSDVNVTASLQKTQP